jgi:NTE family protein
MGSMFTARQLAGAIALPLGLVLGGCAGAAAREPAAGPEPRTVPTPAARTPFALVLSGGTLRGFAHIGVLKVLEANGVRPDLVVGTSAGSFVGALYASGMTPAEVERASREIDFDLVGGWLRAVFGGDGSPVRGFVERHVRTQRIEDFPIRYAAVATEFQRGCLAVFNAGDPAAAVHASTSVPGVFAPARIAGRDYVDGGLVSPVPVRAARHLGAERVIAVDVIYDPAESRLGGTVDRLFQTALVMVHTLARHEAAEADLVIEPKLPHGDEVTLANRDALIRAGEEAARAALPRIRALVQAPPALAPRSAPSMWYDRGSQLETAQAEGRARLGRDPFPYCGRTRHAPGPSGGGPRAQELPSSYRARVRE